MEELCERRVFSKAGLICLTVLGALTLLSDVAALALVTTHIRGSEAAYAVYGIAALLTSVFLIIVLARREDLKSTVSSAKIVPQSMAQYSVYQCLFAINDMVYIISADVYYDFEATDFLNFLL